MLWIAWAGFVGSAIAAAVFAVARTFDLTRYSPSLQLGSLVMDDHRVPATETIGLALYLVLGSTVIPAVYSVLLPWLGGPGWGSGAMLGLLQGGASIAALSWTAPINRCVRAGRLPHPGRFGEGWGRRTAAVVLFGSLVYGAVTGAILGAAERPSGANLAGSSQVA